MFLFPEFPCIMTIMNEVVDVENAARTDEPAASQPAIEHAADQPVVYNNSKYFKRKAGNAQGKNSPDVNLPSIVLRFHYMVNPKNYFLSLRDSVSIN